MHFLDYKKSLGIGIDDKKKIEFFFAKMFNVLNILVKTSSGFVITHQEYFEFCNTAGIAIRSNSLDYDLYDDVLHVLHSHTDSLKDFLHII